MGWNGYHGRLDSGMKADVHIHVEVHLPRRHHLIRMHNIKCRVRCLFALPYLA